MKRKFGWLRDLPDHRDYVFEDPKVGIVGNYNFYKGTVIPEVLQISQKVDLRKWCSPVQDQENLGSCTANAAAGMVEYYERKAFNKYLTMSRLFLYKVTRSLMNMTGDNGAYIRSTMGALALFGAPPEEYYPYDMEKFDSEPSSFCYAFADNYKSLKYYRLDFPSTTPEMLLSKIKNKLYANLALMFGFTVFSSFGEIGYNGMMPMPKSGESVLGGHAVLCVGFDDEKQALIIKNSWGTDWGEEGYFYMPYEYVLAGLTDDWWALTKNSWIDTGAFGFNDE